MRLPHPTDPLIEEVAAEIDRVLTDDGTVVILGGEFAISESVEAALAEDHDTVRYGGQNRFETAVAIAGALGNPTTVLAADADDGNFQYPLVAGPAAATVNGAVLLTDGDTVPPATQEYFDTTNADVTAIGADAAAALPDAETVGNDNPIETAIAVAEEYFEATDLVGIARDDIFADSLTGGAAVGNPDRGPGPMLLVDTDPPLAQEVEDYLTDNDVRAAVIFGGEFAVSNEVEAEIAAAIDDD